MGLYVTRGNLLRSTTKKIFSSELSVGGTWQNRKNRTGTLTHVDAINIT
jgi:hypothetical protein